VRYSKSRPLPASRISIASLLTAVGSLDFCIQRWGNSKREPRHDKEYQKAEVSSFRQPGFMWEAEAETYPTVWLRTPVLHAGKAPFQSCQRQSFLDISSV
jgi:hypothetical protein